MKKTAQYLTILAIALPLLAGCASPKGGQSPRGSLDVDEIAQRIQTVLDEMDRNLAQAARDIAAQGLSLPESRPLLSKLISEHPDVTAVVRTDAKGVIRCVEPSFYRRFEGMSLSEPARMARDNGPPAPLLTHVFQSEGFCSIDLAHPLTVADGQTSGTLFIRIRPSRFVMDVLHKSLRGTDCDCWIIETDGHVLFDRDGRDGGSNLFEELSYQPFEDLLATAREIVAEPEGSGRYRFYGPEMGRIVPKRCRWRTVGLHGTEWRIVVARETGLLGF
ncbi:cache domain-containing protein [bacterium]|nr:cache domain-containing protein [bacterium]